MSDASIDFGGYGEVHESRSTFSGVATSYASQVRTFVPWASEASEGI